MVGDIFIVCEIFLSGIMINFLSIQKLHINNNVLVNRKVFTINGMFTVI